MHRDRQETAVRPPAVLVLLGLALALVLGLSACGSASGGDSRTLAGAARAGEPSSPLEGDDDEDGQVAIEKERARKGPDNDGDGDSSNDSYYDADDQFLLFDGQLADIVQRRAIVSVVTRYYAATAADEAATACGLLSPAAASVVLAYGQPSGPAALHGHGCVAVMAKLLALLHSQMSGGGTGPLKVGVVRVDGDTAKVLLSFGEVWPLRYTRLRRKRGGWKIDALLDYGVP